MWHAKNRRCVWERSSKSFSVLFIILLGGSGASIFYVSTSCMRFEYKTKKMKRKSCSFWFLRPVELLFFWFLSFFCQLLDWTFPSSYYLKIRLKVNVGIVFFSSKGFLKLVYNFILLLNFIFFNFSSSRQL